MYLDSKVKEEDRVPKATVGGLRPTTLGQVSLDLLTGRPALSEAVVLLPNRWRYKVLKATQPSEVLQDPLA